MKITKELLKKIIKEEVGPVKGAHGGALQHMYPGQGNLRNFPSGEPPDNSTRDVMTTRPAYETVGVQVQIEEGVPYVLSGKTRYRLEFEEGSDRKRGYVIPDDQYGFTLDGNRVDWDQNAPAFVRFDPHLEKSIKELVTVDYVDQPEEEEQDEN